MRLFDDDSYWGCLTGLVLWLAVMTVITFFYGWAKWGTVGVGGGLASYVTFQSVINPRWPSDHPPGPEELHPWRVPARYYSTAVLVLFLIGEFTNVSTSPSERWQYHERVLFGLVPPVLAGIWVVDIFLRQCAKTRNSKAAQ